MCTSKHTQSSQSSASQDIGVSIAHNRCETPDWDREVAKRVRRVSAAAESMQFEMSRLVKMLPESVVERHRLDRSDDWYDAKYGLMKRTESESDEWDGETDEEASQDIGAESFAVYLDEDPLDDDE